MCYKAADLYPFKLIFSFENISGLKNYSRIRYDAGDHVAIYPTNNADLVERIGERLSLNLETVFTMKNLDEDSTKKTPFPCPTTYRTALLHYVDIMALPRTHVLKEFAEYTTDEKEKQQLLLMATSSPEGREMYQVSFNRFIHPSTNTSFDLFVRRK